MLIRLYATDCKHLKYTFGGVFFSSIKLNWCRTSFSTILFSVGNNQYIYIKKNMCGLQVGLEQGHLFTWIEYTKPHCPDCIMCTFQVPGSMSWTLYLWIQWVHVLWTMIINLKIFKSMPGLGFHIYTLYGVWVLALDQLTTGLESLCIGPQL